jgi:RNA polymerase sigma factor (sigma-70 family)
VFRLASEPVNALALRLLTGADAGDAAQEALVKVFFRAAEFDPSRDALTWLLAIAHHSFCGEMDRRTAVKRGSGKRALSLDDDLPHASAEPTPDACYEQAVFDAEVEAALRAAERECGFEEFSVFRSRVIEGRSGKQVAEALATSEATISRRLAAVRGRVRGRLAETFTKYSFSSEEQAELARNGLEPNPNKGEDAAFDAAVAEVVHRIQHRAPAPVPPSDAESASQPGSLGQVVRSFLPFRTDPASREAPR